MSSKLSQALIVAALLAQCTAAQADCAGSSVREVREAYAQAQALERKGDQRAALSAYVRAQEYTCETNPVEAAAAKRAAELALPLAQAEQKLGHPQAAADLYELGGHYAAADRALVTALRANPDDPAATGRAIEHFENRALPAFAANNAVRIGLAGGYVLDARLRAEVLAMPAAGATRALQREAADFNDAYLADIVRAVQALPDDPTNMAAVQAAVQRQQAFQQKWPIDLLKASRDELERVRLWAGVTRDSAQGKSFEDQRVKRAEQRAAVLVQRYQQAPSLLAAAMDYLGTVTHDRASFDARATPVKSLALKLGDAASIGNRLTLAASYYDVAGNNSKADAARERQRDLAMQKMQPAIDQAQRQAEDMRKAFGDPKQIEAMKQQALAAREALQKQRPSSQQSAAKADDLEKQLGM